ncbi:MAG: CheR family methyltransferase [Burkholderiaceae bacterium]|nr:CheR family methyltransferase [Burkholderiaceae bacterium]MDO9088677.1 CheR family methyltransferase [Burkholderiaceae bacterium]
MDDVIQRDRWAAVSRCVEAMLGLHFPAARQADLQRGLREAARASGAAHENDFIDWVLAAPHDRSRVQALARHLAIGETYFFREYQTFEVLAETILPALIRARREGRRRLRLWSAACCTGEEPYSLAILLHRLLPDLSEWDITITATDVNEGFLDQADCASYDDWSFRNAPAWLKSQYFRPGAAGRHVLIPEVRSLVRFHYLNLAEDSYPSVASETQAIDVLLCRNALMYFAPTQLGPVVERLRQSLAPGGWLAVSPGEATRNLFPGFSVGNFPGTVLFQKIGMPDESVSAALFSAPWRSAVPMSGAAAEPCATDAARSPMEPANPADPAQCARLARELANEGRLSEALEWCERWLEGDSFDAAAHYLRAMILLERGDTPSARASLNKAVDLDSRFVLAHFALANLARSEGNRAQADKYYANTQRLLRQFPPDTVLPESDGLTAGQLGETLLAFAGVEPYREP